MDEYDDGMRAWLLNETSRLAGISLDRLSITPQEEVVERSDGSGLLDVEVVFSAAGDASDEPLVSIVPATLVPAAHTRDKPGRITSAAVAAEHLVGLGRGRLSYELRVPISKVELVRLNGEDGANRNDASHSFFGIPDSALLLMLAIVGGMGLVAAACVLSRGKRAQGEPVAGGTEMSSASRVNEVRSARRQRAMRSETERNATAPSPRWCTPMERPRAATKAATRDEERQQRAPIMVE